MTIRTRVFALLLALPCLGWAQARWPADPGLLPTTAGDIYMGNLEARIAVLERLARRGAPADAAMLAGLLYHRHRIRGGLEDAERAFVLVDRALSGADPEAAHYLLRATMRSGFHRFEGAAQDLDAAEAAGMPAAQLAPMRRDLLVSLGRYGALPSQAGVGDDFHALAFEAYLLGLRGDAAGSEALYRRAQDAYADSSPVGLAWLYVQQGAALLEAGDPARARPFFEAARQRLPAYTLATEHLAETEALLGNDDRAGDLYREAIAASDDPAFIDALAQLEARRGRAQEATALASRARAGWEARLQRHPHAFVSHAVDYYLDQGEAARAGALARDNAAMRRDIDSLLALAAAERAAGDAETGCAALGEAVATGLSPPTLAGALRAADCSLPAARAGGR